MSEHFEQICDEHVADAIELVIRARPRDLGGYDVRRALPSMRRRLVGPFIFFDHMGPVDLSPGTGMDVRPHPHIGLATITYLFEGSVFHRDSLGTAMEIRPGDVNWMIAGKGIVHSERTPPEVRASGHRSHGIQAWVALRTDEEEGEPRFIHHPASALPVVVLPGVELRLISGDAYGKRAPTPTTAATLYADARLAPGAELEIPSEHEQRAVYVVSGALGCEGDTFEPGTMLVLRPGAPVRVRAAQHVDGTRVMILGGAPIDGQRYIYWNFVASSKDLLEEAKLRWREDRFPNVPGDDGERIPLPE